MFKKFSISILILFLLSLFWLDLDSKESIIPNDNSDVPEIDNPEIMARDKSFSGFFTKIFSFGAPIATKFSLASKQSMVRRKSHTKSTRTSRQNYPARACLTYIA